jgi:hypothetical protein
MQCSPADRAKTLLLAVLLEGPGHFSTDGDFAPGQWNLQIEATTRAGEVLHTRFTGAALIRKCATAIRTSALR